MVGEFMHHHICHQIGQADIAALDPFIEDRATEKPDCVGLKSVDR